MRLLDLNPSWYVGPWIDAAGIERHPAGDRDGMGVIFECPCGRGRCADPTTRSSVGVPFENPTDGGPRCRYGLGDDGRSFWRREGTTFDLLTIQPSIFVYDLVPGENGQLVKKPHWHGWVTLGDVREC